MIFTPKIIFSFLVYNLNTGEASAGRDIHFTLSQWSHSPRKD
jgi:hypothetical protein